MQPDEPAVSLVAFLNARLDETAAAAEARRGIFPSPAVEDSGAVWLHIKRGGNAVVVHYEHPAEGYGDMADLRAWADTEQGWTQDRVLREVEAKRAILAKYELGRRLWDPDAGNWFSPAAEMFGSDMEWLIRTLAAVHSDHPDYRQEWMP